MSATEAVPLGDFAPAQSIRTVAPANDGKIWALNLEQIESGSGAVREKVRIDPADAGGSTHGFDQRHVLYSKLRPNLNKVVLPDEPGIATTELVPLAPNPDRCDRGYLAHYLRSPKFVTWAVGRTAGAKMPRLSMSELWSHEVPLPRDVNEQKRIAAILDKTDAIRRKRQQAIQLADEFLRSVFLEMFGDPVANPRQWPTIKSAEAFDSLQYGTSKKSHETPDADSVPVLRIPNIAENCCDIRDLKYGYFSPTELDGLTLAHGDLLLVRTNGNPNLIAKCAVFDLEGTYAFASYLIRARIDGEAELLPIFVQAQLACTTYRQLLLRETRTTAGNYNISAAGLRKLDLIKPPVDEQERFMEVVRKTRTCLDRLGSSREAAQECNLSLSQRLFGTASAGELQEKMHHA